MAQFKNGRFVDLRLEKWSAVQVLSQYIYRLQRVQASPEIASEELCGTRLLEINTSSACKRLT